VLDALEREVAAVERQLDSGAAPPATAWEPPQGIGPLPADLVRRADAILARQFAATQAVGLAIASNRKQAAVLPRMEVGSQGRPRASYVDYAA
jgi:hypothetical protein